MMEEIGLIIINIKKGAAMKKFLVLFCLLVSSTFIFSQNSNWINYNDVKNISSIALENNFVWIGTTNGLVKLDKTTGEETDYNTSNSGLPGNEITSVAVDENGIKWIGTLHAGLAKYDGSNWTVYNTSNSELPDNIVTSIFIDGNRDMWIGTFNGWAKFDGFKWYVFGYEDGLTNTEVNSLGTDLKGDQWIGTNSGMIINNGNGETYLNTNNSSLPNNSINSITIDFVNGSGNRWIGTKSGLAKYDGANWTIYNTSNSGLPDQWVTSVAIDGSGNKWVGTYDGLAKFDGTSWTVYNTSNSRLPDNIITAIAIDANGNKWIGTNKGLVLLQGSNDVSSEETSSTKTSEANSSNNSQPVLYFCERYDSQQGEVGVSDKFTKGSITVMVKSDNPLGLTDCHIQFDKYNKSADQYEFYKKFDFTIQPDMEYVYFSKNEDSDMSFDEAGQYRVYLLNSNNETVAYALIEIVE